MVDRAYPAASVPANRHAADLQTLQDGLSSASAALRRLAVRGVGRFESPADVPRIVPFLGDPDAAVRNEAANAVAQAVTRSRGADVLPALQALESHDTSCESRARLRFDRQTAARVIDDVSGLSAAAPRADETLSPAAAACVALVLRQNQGLAIDDRLRHALRNTARAVRADDQSSLDALEALGFANDDDKALVSWAMDYHCPGTQEVGCGWSLRFVAVQRSSALDDALRPGLERASHDAVFQVRLAALRKLGAAIPQTATCAPLLAAVADASETILVRLEAASLLDVRCREHDAIVEKLRALVADLSSAPGPADWHLPARALEALARVSPAAAGPLVRVAAASRVWQVRAAAARAATASNDEAALLAMAGEAVPNVRTEVLDGLARLKSAAVSGMAITALDSRDFQLLRSAALALKGTTARDPARPALLHALEVLTREGKDTSRDPRQAILDRLKEIGAPATAIQPYLRDFDPQIASAAADVLATITGTRPDPAPAFRAPIQPTEAALQRLPKKATLVLANGDEIGLDLLADEAPIAVARFVALASAGYYNGLTFHRVEPLFVIQGGSPGASEYMGDARYWRDEIGVEHHTRGAVGLSTRGRDSVDGQIFIDLTDWPRLNYIYTIFARVSRMPVTSSQAPRVRHGMDAADHVTEGAVITRVLVGR
jgi:cyclophilin family peptidyl-prolyl cis-trans isomerase